MVPCQKQEKGSKTLIILVKKKIFWQKRPLSLIGKKREQYSLA